MFRFLKSSKKHGRWKDDGVLEVCSVCNHPVMQPHIHRQPQFNYCPYCGAKMRKRRTKNER